MRHPRIAIAVLVVIVAVVAIWKLRSSGGDDAGSGGASGGSSDPNSTALGTGGGATGRNAAPGSIGGRVTRATDGTGIAGAVVAVAREHAMPLVGRIGTGGDDTPSTVVTTDANGAWSIPAIPGGSYTIGATAIGFLPGSRARIAVPAGGKASVDLALAAGGSVVSGTVTDVTGGPIAGARVTATRSSRRIHAERIELVALTNTEGKYQLAVGDGEYTALASHDDYTRAFKQFEIRGAPATVDFVLAPGSSIRGVVVTRDGKPVPGARISASNPRSLMSGFGGATADDSGAFVLTGLGSGAVKLTAVAKGYASNNPVVVELGIGEHVDGIKVVVDKALSISGRVVRANKASEGIANVFVGGFSISAGASATAKDPSDASGAFEIHGVKPGSYMLFAIGDGFVPDVGKSVEVADKDVTDVVIELAVGATLSGRVEPGTIASVGLEMDMSKISMNPIKMMDAVKTMIVQGESDATGAFTLRAAPPGEYSIVATTTDGKRGALAVVVTTEDQQGLVVKLEPRASIAGKVTDETGAAVAGVRVDVAKDDRDGMFVRGNWGRNDGALTGADGTFKLVGLEPGKVGLVVADERGRIPFARVEKKDEPHRLELSKGQELTGVQLTVEARDGVIKGIVLNADRSPAPDAWVTVRPDVNAAGRERRRDMMMAMMNPGDPIVTGPDGSFTVQRLRRGTYEVQVDGAKGNARASKSGVKTGETVTLVLESLGSISGRVTLAGAPVTEFDLGCRAPMMNGGGGRFGGNDVLGRRFTSDDGSYTIDRLVPGEYTCNVQSNVGTATGKVVVATGPVKLDLAIAGFATLTGVAVDAIDGKPLPGLVVLVAAEGIEGKAFAELMAGKAPTTDASGRFTIERVPVGKGTVHVAPKDATFNRLASREYTATAGQRVDLGTIKLVPPKEGGGTLGFFAAAVDGKLAIVDVKSDTPADKAGVLVGDKIVSIDGRPVADLGADVAKQMISPGALAIGQRVALVLDRGGTQVPVALVAEKF